VELGQQRICLSGQGKLRYHRIQVQECHQVPHHHHLHLQQALLEHGGQQGQADHASPDRARAGQEIIKILPTFLPLPAWRRSHTQHGSQTETERVRLSRQARQQAEVSLQTSSPANY